MSSLEKAFILPYYAAGPRSAFVDVGGLCCAHRFLGEALKAVKDLLNSTSGIDS